MKTMPDEIKEEVLYAFSVEPEIDAALLEEYIRKYPQCRDELIDLSLELSLMPKGEEMPANEGVSESVESLWSSFQSMLEASDPISLPASELNNPLESLDKRGFIELAKQLNVSRMFLTRVRDKTIIASTLPMRFVEKVANAVGIGVESMRNVLAAPSTIAPGVRFKADGKPEATKQMTFDEAIENSNLSEKQQSELRAMKD